MLTPRGQRWHHLRADDEELDKRHEVREWLDAVERKLFSRPAIIPRANYASQQHEIYMALGAFGTGALFVGEDTGQCWWRRAALPRHSSWRALRRGRRVRPD